MAGGPVLRLLTTCLAVAVFAASAQGGELRSWTGGPTPALALKDLYGREHQLADYRGRLVLVSFWATWCEPCRDEMPSFDRLRRRFDGRLEVLAVNYGEGEARVRAFLGKIPVGFPVLLDRDATAAKAWQARVLPTTFLVDPAGRVRYSAVGELDWSAPSIEATLRSLLRSRTAAGVK